MAAYVLMVAMAIGGPSTAVSMQEFSNLASCEAALAWVQQNARNGHLRAVACLPK